MVARVRLCTLASLTVRNLPAERVRVLKVERIHLQVELVQMVEIGKALERFVRSTEEVIEATRRKASSGADGREAKGRDAYHDSLKVLHKTWERLQTRIRNASNAEKANHAGAWVKAHVERKLFFKIELLLVTQREHVEAAISTSRHLSSRHTAIQVVSYAAESAFLLLDRVCQAAHVVTECSSSSNRADKEAADIAVTTMARRGFNSAVADAARGMAKVEALVRPGTGALQGVEGPAFLHATVAASTAAGVCRYMRTMAQLLFDRLIACMGPDGQLLPSLPSGLVQLIEAVTDSQLLAAAAAAVVDSPYLIAEEGFTPAAAHKIRCHMGNAAGEAAKGLALHVVCNDHLACSKGSDGQRLAAGLLRVMRHVAVRRLQVALLDQLAAHAGMGAALEGEGQEGEGQGQHAAQVDGWAVSSGTCWVAVDEARTGQILSASNFAGREAGWLEDHHCHIVYATLGDWGAADVQALLTMAGMPAGPPPVLAAKLAARAAEALCRLCRGEGLGGAYGPAPEWRFAMGRQLVRELVYSEAVDVSALPAAGARACLPYWLEAAGWAVALLADATAAAMGRLPATRRTGRHSALGEGFVQDGTQASSLALLLHHLQHRTWNQTYGIDTLSHAAQADVRRRMSRCGLAASLDHTLRLAYSAQQVGGDVNVATELSKATLRVAMVLLQDLAPVVPPPAAAAAAGHGATTRAGEGGSSSDSRGDDADGRSGGQQASTSSSGSSGNGAEHQLGLVFTLSKRAAMLTRALEAEAGAGAQGGGGPGDRQGREQLLSLAGDIMMCLHAITKTLEGEVLRRVGAARQAMAAAGNGGDDVDDTACGQAGAAAGCGDEAHEALALATRAACNLAAPLGWILAADLAAAAAAAAEGTAAQRAALHTKGVVTVCDMATRLTHMCRQPPLLPPQQLLACQPARLLATACMLAAALPAGSTYKERLSSVVPGLVLTLAADRALSGRVRSWLSPRPAAASPATAHDSGVDGDPCTGALVAPLRCFIRHTLGLAPGTVVRLLALLKIAAGEVQPKAGGRCCEDGGDVTGEADGGFQQCAAAMSAYWRKGNEDPSVEGLEAVVLPDGSDMGRLLDEERDAGDRLPPPPPPLSPSGPLPPPLALPPSRAGAFPRLRMCGSPRCGNFAGEFEEALPLKQCGGCRAVRYCGVDCQRAHWREGHKVECKVQAATTGATIEGV